MLYLGMLVLQVLCIVDVIRRGRNQLWIMALVFLPVASAIAYLIVEVLPGAGTNRTVRRVRAQASAAVNPEREVRAARHALEVADTVANTTRLSDALAALRRWDEAVPLYRAAAGRSAPDARLGEKLARAQFEGGDPAAALATLDASPSASAASDRDRVALLRARVLGETGGQGEALAIYADIVTRIPGEEARCRYAALLIERGDRAAALAVLEEVERRMKLLDRHTRAAEAEMYRWATERLRELRAR